MSTVSAVDCVRLVKWFFYLELPSHRSRPALRADYRYTADRSRSSSTYNRDAVLIHPCKHRLIHNTHRLILHTQTQHAKKNRCGQKQKTDRQGGEALTGVIGEWEISEEVHVHACVRACMCVRLCVGACVRACVNVHWRRHTTLMSATPAPLW